MRKSFAIALLGLMTLALPVLAIEVQTVLPDHDPATGGAGGRVDCEGTIVWDTGMYDEFTPPSGCSTAFSAGCFVEAINDGGFPDDGRRGADDWLAGTADPITGIKLWGRYNTDGWDYWQADPTTLHGFCVKFYEAQPGPWCPDGSVAGEEAIGSIVYSEYCQNFEYEVPSVGVGRQANYCITLDVPFVPTPDTIYWVSVSADFDFTLGPSGLANTQWFWRAFEGLGISFCEASWWDTWNTPNTNWNGISVAVAMPCWTMWDAAFVLYSSTVPPIATESRSVGQIKANYK